MCLVKGSFGTFVCRLQRYGARCLLALVSGLQGASLRDEPRVEGPRVLLCTSPGVRPSIEVGDQRAANVQQPLTTSGLDYRAHTRPRPVRRRPKPRSETIQLKFGPLHCHA